MFPSKNPTIQRAYPLHAPDQFSGVAVTSMAAWCMLAMLTNRRVRNVVSRLYPPWA